MSPEKAGATKANRFIIYWWARTETRISGHDEIELPQEELDEDEADEILQEKSMGHTNWRPDKYPNLPSFESKYLNATFCENFGVVKVVKKA